MLKELVVERLTSLGCSDLPAPVREQLEMEIARSWDDLATRLVTKIITPKHISVAFAAHLGVRRRSAKAQNLGVSGVSGSENP